MKLSEFLSAAGSTRMAQRTIDAARLVLIDGMRATDAARQMGMKRQQVQEAVQRLESAHRSARAIPDGWERITVYVPPENVAEIREIEAHGETACRSDRRLMWPRPLMAVSETTYRPKRPAQTRAARLGRSAYRSARSRR
jgi:predicted DNA-binding protein (UPF0251 family)